MRCCGCWAATGYFRAKKVIASCETFEQLAIAHTYSNLAMKKVFNSKHIEVTPEQFESLKIELKELLGKQEMKIRRRGRWKENFKKIMG
jgi:hypothetical protein